MPALIAARKNYEEAYNKLRNARKSAFLIREEIEIFLSDIHQIMQPNNIKLLNNLANIIQAVDRFLDYPYNQKEQEIYQSAIKNLSDHHFIDPLSNTPTLLSINLALLFFWVLLLNSMCLTQNEKFVQTAIFIAFGSIPNLHTRVINQDKQTIIRSMQSLQNAPILFKQDPTLRLRKEEMYYMVGRPLHLYSSTGRFFKQSNLVDYLSLDEIMKAFSPDGLAYSKRSQALDVASWPTHMKEEQFASPIFLVKLSITNKNQIYDFNNGIIQIRDETIATPISAIIYLQDPHLGKQIFGPFNCSENAPTQETIPHRDYSKPPKISF